MQSEQNNQQANQPTFEEAMARLNGLIGHEDVKKKIAAIMNS